MKPEYSARLHRPAPVPVEEPGTPGRRTAPGKPRRLRGELCVPLFRGALPTTPAQSLAGTPNTPRRSLAGALRRPASRHRIVAPCAKRMAAREAFRGQPAPAGETVL